MSSNRKPIIIDRTGQENSSGEAIIVIAVVLGFFLTILIGLCVLRRRETIKRLRATTESSKGSYSMEQVSGTKSTSPPYLEALSASEGSFELVRNGGITPLEQVENIYHLEYPQSATNYCEYESSEKVLHRNSPEFEYYDEIQSDDSGSIIFQGEFNHYYEHGSDYSKTTRSAAEETSSTSMEKIDDYELLWMYEDHINREQYDSYNHTPEVGLAIKHPVNVAQNTSNLFSEMSPLDINVSKRGGHANQDKWHFLNDDNTSGSTISTSNVEKTPPHHWNGIKSELRSLTQSLYSDSLTSLEKKNPVGIQIPETVSKGIVDVAVHTPYSNRTTSSTMTSEITDSQFARGRKDIFHSPENGQQHPDNGPLGYRNQEAAMIVYGEGRNDDRGALLYGTEHPPMLTSIDYTVNHAQHR